MKKYIDHLLNTIGLCLSYLPLSILTKSLHSCRDKIYSGYLRRKFAHMGNSFFLWHPHTLIGTEFIHIGDGCTFESGLQLSAWASEGKAPRIVIGNHCLIRSNAHITASNCITIGNNLLTGTNVFITDNSHGQTDSFLPEIPPRKRQLYSKGAVCIGDNVWLGNNVCIMPGVTIGNGAIIGANSVVTHDIPDYCVAAGIPAKKIKMIEIIKR